MGLGLLNIDLGIQLQVDLEVDFLRFAGSGEGYAGGGEVDLCGGGGHVWDVERDEDDVLFGFRGRGALSPENYTASVYRLTWMGGGMGLSRLVPLRGSSYLQE